MNDSAQKGEIGLGVLLGLFLLTLVSAVLFGYFYLKDAPGSKPVFTAADLVVIPEPGGVIESPGDAALGILDEVFLQAKVASEPTLDGNGEDYLLAVDLPKKITGNVGGANLFLGKADDEIIILKAREGLVDAEQEWIATPVSDLLTLLKKGDPVLVRIYYQIPPESLVKDPDCVGRCQSFYRKITELHGANKLVVETMETGQRLTSVPTIGPVSALVIYTKD